MKLLKLTNLLILSLFSILFFVSCSNDDPEEIIIDPQTVLEEEQAETTQILSNANTKTWKITQATLTNSSGTFDISSNFNVLDDEFIYSSGGNLEWRQGNDINIEGTNSQETLLDYYRSPISSSFSFNPDSSSDLTAFDGRFLFTLINETTINGAITYSGRNNTGGELNLTLENKQPGDYQTPNTNGLVFTEAFTFESGGLTSLAPGLIGSNSDNSLFFATREDASNDGTINPERIIKFNIDNGTTEEYLFYNSDFVSKQLHIINNQLVVIGGQYINTYPLDISSPPNSTTHGLAITRFGMSVVDDDAYIIGGDLTGDGLGNYYGEKIYKWSLSNQSLEFVTDLPEERFGARSAIVNNKLYVFGGTTTFAPTEQSAQNTIYIYDLINGGIVNEQMNSEADYTYVDKYENLIYVGGYHRVFDNEGTVIDYAFSIGVYNTEDGTYQDLETDLSSEGWKNIYGMCIFNGKMYVIYGDFTSDIWQIMSAEL